MYLYNMKIVITEEQLRLIESKISQAVIEIKAPLAYLSPKDRFQIVPYWKTLEDKIYIVKGVAGGKTISTKNIEVHKVFDEDEKMEMVEYLNKLREEYWEKVKHYYK